jgi:hypothetical protein
MRGRAAGAALPVLIVVVLVAVVAIASTGSSVGGGSGRARPPSESLYDTVLTLLYVAVALGGVLVLYGLMQRRQIAQQVATGRYPRGGLISFLAFSVGVAAAFYFGLIRWRPPTSTEEEGELAFPGVSPVPTLPEEAETSYEASISWMPVLLVVLVLGAVAAYVVAERRASRGRSSERELAEQVAAVLDMTLDDLRAEADPRKAVIAAYSRLERVLAANGTPRLASETADEYLPRVLADLAIDPDAIGRLTALFSRAKFSSHEIDPTMKEDAIGALERVRDELRSLHAERVAPSEGASARVGAAS